MYRAVYREEAGSGGARPPDPISCDGDQRKSNPREVMIPTQSMITVV